MKQQLGCSAYEGLPRISKNLLVITWILNLSPNFHHHLQSSHLVLEYNDTSNFVILASTRWSLPVWACLEPVVILLGSFNGYETPPFQLEFHFRKHAEITGGQVRWAGRVGNSGHVIFCHEFPCDEWGVWRHIVVVQQPVSVLPHLRPCAPHIFPLSSQNLAVKIPIDSLTRWNKLLMNNS